MKKLKEVTDKKKTSLLKTIDEKLTAAARELGLSLEQRTVRMKQRDKKVRAPSIGLCTLCCLGGGGRAPLSFPAGLHLLSSPPEESRPCLPGGWAAGVLRAWRARSGAPRGGRRAQARPAQSFSPLALPFIAHFILEEEWLCTSRLLTFLYIIKNIYII